MGVLKHPPKYAPGHVTTKGLHSSSALVLTFTSVLAPGSETLTVY